MRYLVGTPTFVFGCLSLVLNLCGATYLSSAFVLIGTASIPIAILLSVK